MSNRKYSDDMYQEVYERYKAAQSEREIAESLDMSPSTVHDIIERMKAKENQGIEQQTEQPLQTEHLPVNGIGQTEQAAEQLQKREQPIGVLEDGSPAYHADPGVVFPQEGAAQSAEPTKPGLLDKLWGWIKEKAKAAKNKFDWEFPSTKKIKDKPLRSGSGDTDWTQVSDWSKFVDWVIEVHTEFIHERLTFIPKEIRSMLYIPRKLGEKIAWEFAPLYYNFQKFAFGGKPHPVMSVIKYLLVVGEILMGMIKAIKSGTWDEWCKEHEGEISPGA